MRELLAGWIIIQLFVFGYALTEGRNEMISGTYDCSSKSAVSPAVGAFFPLKYFVEDIRYYRDTEQYCENKANIEDSNE